MDVKKVCVDGVYKKSGEYEFCHSETLLVYSQAKSYCENKGLQLVEPISENHFNVLSLICDQSKDCTWLGLTCPMELSEQCDISISGWQWQSGENLKNT